MTTEISGPCSINHCPQPATQEETGASEHWLFTVRYCAEHARQIGAGTPVGPAGINPESVVVRARGLEEPQTGLGQTSLGPQ